VLVALSAVLAFLRPPGSDAQDGRTLVTVVDAIAPASWSDLTGHHCPPGWQQIDGALMCKHFSTFNRSRPNGQRALYDVRVTTVGRACPGGYQRSGDTLCLEFVTVSTSDVYRLIADVTYGGAYDNGGEGSLAFAPRCNAGWTLASHPYQGGIGMCLWKITTLVRTP